MSSLGGLDIPNFYNKTEVGNSITNLNLVNNYTKNQVGALIYNINLVDYYTETKIGSQLTDFTTITYLQGNYMTSLSITTLMKNYASITPLVNNFYDKTHLDNQFSLKTDVSQLTEFVTTDYLTTKYTNSVEISTGYYKKTDIDNILLSYSTGSSVDYNFYTKTETDNLLADKIFNIGDISLPGMLDTGTSGYTNPRIRCNANLGGYSGYAELNAASSYDMFLNLPTTRTDGGWMYFKINNDDYIQLPNSDNNVNIHKNTTISGNLNAAGRILIDGSHLNVQPKSSTNPHTLVLDQSMSSEFGSDSHGMNAFGRQGGNSHLKLYNSRSASVCNVLTDGNLDVGKVKFTKTSNRI